MTIKEMEMILQSVKELEEGVKTVKNIANKIRRKLNE